MIRKIFYAGIATAALMIGAAQANETIVWWDFLSGGDGVRMKAMLDEFNKEHEGKVHIDATTLEWGVPFYTKVQTSAAVGQGPDVMTYHESRMPLGVSTGSLSAITPAELAASGIKASDFGPANWKAAQGADGKQYGVPLDIHSIILYYNKDLLKKAGLLGDDGKPKGSTASPNWDAALAKLTTNGVVGLSRTGRRRDRVAHLLHSAQPAGRRVPQGRQVPRRRQSRQGDDGDRGNAEMGQERLDASQDRISGLDRPLHLGQGGDAHQRRLGSSDDGRPRQEGPALRLGRDPDPGPLRRIPRPGRIRTRSRSPTARATRSIRPSASSCSTPSIGSTSIRSNGRAAAMCRPIVPVQESAAFKALKPNSDYSSLAKTAVFDPVSALAGVASPVYDAAGNYVIPAMNGEMAPADAAKQMRDDLQGQAK